MTSEINQPITSGQYIIEKFFTEELQKNSIQADGSSAPVVMTSAPQIAPVPWTIVHKDEKFSTMMVNDGFASKVGDEKFLFTRPEGSQEIQEWEFISVLTQGPKVYYIRSRAGQAWTVSGKPNQTEDTPVGLEDLGPVWIESPPEKFLFTICEAASK